MPKLSGTGLLADDFYLMAHDPAGGRPRLSGTMLGFGAAGALVGELLIAGRLRFDQGVLLPVGPAPAYGTASAHVVSLVLCEQAPFARAVVRALAPDAEALVAERLGGAGVLARRTGRRPWQGERWEPTSVTVALVPAAVLCTRLIRGEALDLAGLVNLGLLRITSLEQTVLREVRDSAPQVLRRVDEALGDLPWPLQELLGQTMTAISTHMALNRSLRV
jgi:hypothetical protein